MPVVAALVAAVMAIAAGAHVTCAGANAGGRAGGTAVAVRGPRSSRSRSSGGSTRDRTRGDRHLLVRVERAMRVTARPGGGRVVGVVPARSPYYGVQTRAWVLRVSPDGRFGLIPVPYAGEAVTGWLRLRGLRTSMTRISVRVDLSAHRLFLRRGDHVIFSAPAATGAPSTPTPVGRYVVSDRVAVRRGEHLRHVRVRSVGDPDTPAGRMDRRQPARDPRDERAVVDRTIRELRVPAGLRTGPGPAATAPAARHARVDPALSASGPRSALHEHADVALSSEHRERRDLGLPPEHDADPAVADARGCGPRPCSATSAGAAG